MESDTSFELAGGPYAVTAARLALADLDSRLDAALAFDVRLLVSELVTNSVQHARVAAEDSIVLVLTISDETVRVEVRDEGPGFKPPVSPPPDNADKGWGLFLVEQLADSWGVGDGGKGVWFEIRRDRGEPDEQESESTAA
jgi:anti-sigma regulatory factor (Ser/Thr protein kinase)